MLLCVFLDTIYGREITRLHTVRLAYGVTVPLCLHNKEIRPKLPFPESPRELCGWTVTWTWLSPVTESNSDHISSWVSYKEEYAICKNGREGVLRGQVWGVCGEGYQGRQAQSGVLVGLDKEGTNRGLYTVWRNEEWEQEVGVAKGA